MYSELIIRPHKMADEIIYPDVARKLVAEACDRISIPPIMFNRQEDGKSIQGKFWAEDKHAIDAGLPFPPAIFFDGGKGFLRIYAMGEPGRSALNECAGNLAMAVAKQTNGPFGFEMKEGDCGIKTKGSRLYSIRRLVADKKPKSGQRFFKVDPLEVKDDLARIIYRGLLSQAKWLGIHGNDSSKNLEWTLPDMDTLDIDIVSGEPYPILINDNNNAYGYANLVFSMNATLDGPWQCGLLRSRGYGSIRPYILKGRAS